MKLREVALLSTVATAALACGGQPDGNAQKTGWTSEPATVCAGGSTVRGVDVSVYQGSINWGAAKASGLGFAIARVSDGTGNPDSTFAGNWSGIKAAGMVRGVYQFFRASEDPKAQADLLVNAIGSMGPGDLPPVADVEVMDGQSGSTLVANLAAWVAEIKAKLGVTPMIYTAPGFWNPLPSTGQFSGEVLWVANWGVSCPDAPTPWSKWAFWQDADNGSVPGISGAVDTDVFNGTLAQLQSFGGAAPYAAQYVSQSFPLASTALTMTEGQVIPSYIELKNVGAKAWDSKTRIGTTQPRDRTSVFADSTWIAPNRPAGVTGTVAPGSSYKFQFDLEAPNKPGTYFEYFGVVEEGVAWFSDPGQGGPQDNDLEVQITVVAPDYRGDFKDQSFPLAPTALSAHVGDVVDGYIELTNSGTQPWKAGTTKLAPIPRDKPSPFADASWPSPTRVSSVMADVPPGAVGRFPVKLDAKAVSDTEIELGLVEESVTWFADAPKGGGPADGFLKVHLVVVPDAIPLDAGVKVEADGAVVEPDGGLVTPEPSADGGGTSDGSSGGSSNSAAPLPGDSGGCSIGAPGGTVPSWAAALGLLFVVLPLRRRRR